MNPSPDPRNDGSKPDSHRSDRTASCSPSAYVPVWISPFAAEIETKSLRIGNLFNVACPIPKNWNVLPQPAEYQGCAYMPPEGNALLRIGMGKLAATSIDHIAAGPAINLANNGIDIPVVISLPLQRSVSPTKGHNVNFPAKVPAQLLGGESNDTINYFQNITVFEIGGHWLSIETSAWGNGCNPAEEFEQMQKIHLPFTVAT